MDATVSEKKLDFMKFRHTLYGAKARVFEFSGKIKKYGRFLKSSLPGFHQSNQHIQQELLFSEERVVSAEINIYKPVLVLLTIKNKTI